ncbi:hypothetical protein Tco_0261085 [Tanacetum coccineum]
MDESLNPKPSTQQHEDEPQNQGTMIPFDTAPNVDFKSSQIHFKDNNEVALINPDHSNKKYFLTGMVKQLRPKEPLKAFLPLRWRLLMAQIIQCLRGKTGGEKVIPYPRFLSLLLELRMKGYGIDGVTIIPTQIFSINNLILKKGQPEGPAFTAHMMAICNADAPAQQATSNLMFLWVTSEEGAHPQLNRADSIAEADPKNSNLNDCVPQKQGMDERTQNKSYDHLSADTDLNIKEASSNEASQMIKLEDLSKLVHNVKADFMELDSPEDDPIIVVAEIPKPPSPRFIQLQELTNQVLILQSQKYKMENEKRQAKAEVTLLSAKPSFLDDAEEKGSDSESANTKLNFVIEDGDHVHLTKEQIKYYKAKLQYDKHYDKMLNRRAKSRITNCDVDYQGSNYTKGVQRGCKQRLKASVRYEDYPAGTLLNEPILGMIIFISYHRQDFLTIEDLGDFSNEMMYIVQEIFFRLHQGPRLNDHARTFSSFLLTEIDKRNLNLLKQIRTIEQL